MAKKHTAPGKKKRKPPAPAPARQKIARREEVRSGKSRNKDTRREMEEKH